jgi:hypothetical protein
LFSFVLAAAQKNVLKTGIGKEELVDTKVGIGYMNELELELFVFGMSFSIPTKCTAKLLLGAPVNHFPFPPFPFSPLSFFFSAYSSPHHFLLGNSFSHQLEIIITSPIHSPNSYLFATFLP